MWSKMCCVEKSVMWRNVLHYSCLHTSNEKCGANLFCVEKFNQNLCLWKKTNIRYRYGILKECHLKLCLTLHSAWLSTLHNFVLCIVSALGIQLHFTQYCTLNNLEFLECICALHKWFSQILGSFELSQLSGPDRPYVVHFLAQKYFLWPS